MGAPKHNFPKFCPAFLLMFGYIIYIVDSSRIDIYIYIQLTGRTVSWVVFIGQSWLKTRGKKEGSHRWQGHLKLLPILTFPPISNSLTMFLFHFLSLLFSAATSCLLSSSFSFFGRFPVCFPFLFRFHFSSILFCVLQFLFCVNWRWTPIVFLICSSLLLRWIFVCLLGVAWWVD